MDNAEKVDKPSYLVLRRNVRVCIKRYESGVFLFSKASFYILAKIKQNIVIVTFH